MAKLKVFFGSNVQGSLVTTEWIMERANKAVSVEKAKKALNRLKKIECILKPNGDPLVTDVQEISGDILEESSVLSISKD